MAEPFDLVISGGTLVSSGWRQRADLAVRGGRIAAIAAPGTLREGSDVLDARGACVLPGVIDAHVHFRQPGLEHEEDWLSGTRAAVHGGVTSVLEMPNTVPPTATLDTARQKLALAAATAYCDFGIFGLLGAEPDAVAELVSSGLVVGLKAFLGPTTGELPSPSDAELRTGLLAARAGGLRVVFHAEEAAIIERASAALRADSRTDARAHLEARPIEAEVASIDRIGDLLSASRAAGHIAHLTSNEGLAAVERWRALGIDLTCEVTPHHALLGADVYDRFGGLAKVNPPIRSGHGHALLEALEAGRVDIVASDHAPHLLAHKQRPSVWDVPAGFAGVETLLPLMLSQVDASWLSLEGLVRATSERPAQAFGLWPRKGSLAIGSDADLVLVDPRRRGVIRAADLHGSNNHSPWEGWRTVGAPVATIVRGRVVVREGELLGEPGWGVAVTGQTGDPGAR